MQQLNEAQLKQLAKRLAYEAAVAFNARQRAKQVHVSHPYTDGTRYD